MGMGVARMPLCHITVPHVEKKQSDTRLTMTIPLQTGRLRHGGVVTSQPGPRATSPAVVLASESSRSCCESLSCL